MSFEIRTTSLGRKVLESAHEDRTDLKVYVEHDPIDTSDFPFDVLPLNIYVGCANAEDYTVLSLGDFRQLVDRLNDLCCHYEAGGA